MTKEELITEVNYKDGLLTVVLQDFQTDEVLMVGFMNEEALQKTLETGEAWFYSRSRQRLWHKGETSGHRQLVKEIKVDCDGDAILLKVESVGGRVCHTGQRSCFFRGVEKPAGEKVPEAAKAANFQLLNTLYQLILDRKMNPKAGSYTCYLWEKGQDKILKKVGEEAAEVIIGSKNNCQEEVIYETADLIYHLLVLLAWHGIEPAAIIKELEKRR